jgi:hypothetical protein
MPHLPTGEVLPIGWESIPVIANAKAQERWVNDLLAERAAERAKVITPKDVD